MGKSNKLTDIERDYIAAVYPQLTAKEIAQKLGRTERTVYKVIAESKPLNERPPEKPPGKPPDDSMSRLVELRETLRSALLDAKPASIAPLAREYRATIQDIERREGVADDGPDVLGDLAAALLRKSG